MDRMSELEVSSLIVMIRASDEAAFAELVRRYTPMIKRVLSDLDVAPSHADEAWAEAVVVLYRAALSYDLSREGVTFGLYSQICVTRAMYDLLSKLQMEEAGLLPLDEAELAAPSGVDSRLVLAESLRRYLSVAAAFLSALELDVFRLYLKGYTTRQMAEALSRSPKSVDNAKNRMFRRLREHSSLFFN